MHELRVLTGQQKGAALPLIGQQWVIGSVELCDLLLDDKDIAPCHAELRFQHDKWQLLPAEGKITGHELAEIVEITPDTPFRLAEVVLMIQAADMPWPASSPVPPLAVEAEEKDETSVAPTPTPLPGGKASHHLFPRWARIAAVSMMLLLMITVTSWILQPGYARPESNSEPVKPRLTDSTLLSERLSHLLRERDLQRDVALVRHQDEVILEGRLDEQQRQQLERLLKTLHQDYDIGVSLRNNTVEDKVRLPFRIVQITAGPRANIVTENGRRLFIGDEEDGLRLVAITPSQVQFAGRSNVTVKW